MGIPKQQKIGGYLDITGKQYGKLTAVSFYDSNNGKGALWLCSCDCGNEKIVQVQSLQRGATKSCGKCPQDYKVTDAGVYIKLSTGHEFLVDKSDFEFVHMHRWHLALHGHVCLSSSLNGIRHPKLHRLLLNCPKKNEIDHINLNPLDNRRSNLRIVTRQQNSMNIGRQRNNTTGYKGVCYDKRTNMYTANLGFNGSSIWLGRHNTAEEAARAYDCAALLYHGEYAWLNFPEEAGKELSSNPMEWIRARDIYANGNGGGSHLYGFQEGQRARPFV